LEDLLQGTVVFFANAHQLYHLGCRSTSNQDRFVISHDLFEFDLIIIDEASQYPVDHILSSLQLVRSGTVEITNVQSEENEMNATHLGDVQIVNPEVLQTHVIVVGDNNQLPPVQPIKPPVALESILRSIFDYYVTGFRLGDEQLQFNYRSHHLIVGFIDSLGLYEKSFISAPQSPHADAVIQGNPDLIGEAWTRSILDPQNIVVGLVHENRFDTSLSMLEARITTKIIVDLFIMQQLEDAEAQRSFWTDFLGIVAPHNAHSKTIINMLFEALTSSGLNLLPHDELMNNLNNTIYSVEKFQGSERTVIIATIGVSDEDQLKAEEDFIYDRNRLNVLITRARSKMILVCSRNFLDYIPEENDRFFDVSIANRFLEYCNTSNDIHVEVNGNEYDLQCYLRST
jgi:superfamily I DNA and/or RNA helicase